MVKTELKQELSHKAQPDHDGHTSDKGDEFRKQHKFGPAFEMTVDDAFIKTHIQANARP